MLKKVGIPTNIIASPNEIYGADSLIIPGVGKFDHAMKQIYDLGLQQALDHSAKVRKIPILGICLGMQLMTLGSEEGIMPGLGWINAKTIRIDGARHGLRVPHMGWNVVRIQKPNPCFDNDGFLDHRFYFVHSYAVECYKKDDVLTTTSYGCEFVSAFSKDNFLGVQFHPEKSHKFGISFFRRFVSNYCNA